MVQKRDLSRRPAGRVFFGLIVLAVIGTAPSDAPAQRNPNKASARCRKVIAKATTQLIAAGLNGISACHRQRDKGKSTADCNVLVATPSTNFGRLRNRVAAQIGAACKPNDPVFQNYPNNDIVNSLLPEVQRRLERSGADLQGLPNLVGDKPKIKCHGAIAQARNAIMLEVVRKSSSCQKRLDKSATSFGALAGECVATPGKAAAKANRVLGKCASISGSDVGSCASLPGCVVDTSTTLAEGLAAVIYGGPTICGNGLIEGFEVCDDGNADDTDACTAACTEARCGDGAVRAGVEECDDGNDNRDDTCDNCSNPVCGDGRVAVGVEECDDGNAVPNDGCTGCVIDPLICGASGVLATVTLDYDPVSFVPIAGMFLHLRYPSFLSIPGSLQSASVVARVTDLTNPGAFFSPVDRDTNMDGTDDELRTLYIIDPPPVPPGNFERILFDCVPGTGVRPADFGCGLSEVTDEFLNIVPQEVVDQATSCFVSMLESPGGSGTTTTTSPPGTTTTVATTTTSSTTTTTTLSLTRSNGTLEAGQKCDDGNLVGGDGCDSMRTA
jgi:cysteine-rich repeat protein